MKFSLATNFDDELIDKIKGYDVFELYGRLKHDVLCGGRPNNTQADVDRIQFEKHVKKARDNGINFNYLINGACLNSCETNKQWQKNVSDFLDYLQEKQVNALTITNPLLLAFVKKHYPQFICRVSTFAGVNNLKKAKYWEDIGADIICADFCSINRDFDNLQTIVNGLKSAKIELLATNSCVKDCPNLAIHSSGIAHASSRNGNEKFIDWCLLDCQYSQLLNNTEYIRSPWIRPEDLKYYKQIGIEHIKITERGFPTEILLKRLKAYYNESYDGNLLDLVQGHGYQFDGTKNKKIIKKDNFDSIDDIINEIYRIRGFGCEREYPSHIYIDNKKLDGFLDYFVSGMCHKNCANCKYCENWAKNAITDDESVKDYLIELYKLYREKLI